MSHTENMKRLQELISAQTKGHEKTAVECVGRQLLDIARHEPASAELLVKDLEVSGMGIADAEKKIKEAADKNRQGNCGFVGWEETDTILRKFYGLPDRPEEGEGEATSEEENAGGETAAEAAARIAELEKSLKMANPAVSEFRGLFDAANSLIVALKSKLETVRCTDPEAATKLDKAMAALAAMITRKEATT
jgi:hypothetical protein